MFIIKADLNRILLLESVYIQINGQIWYVIPDVSKPNHRINIRVIISEVHK